jgi:hypothetical protein
MFRRSPAFRPSPAASVAEVSVDLSRETALAALMDWVSLYVPTWGTSVILHVALVLLAAFMAVQIQAEPAFTAPSIQPVPLPPRADVRTRTVPRDRASDAYTKYDKPMSEQASRRLGGDPLADVLRKNPTPMILGLGPSKRNHGPFDIGTDHIGIFRPPGPGGPRPEGGEATPAKVVYVVDRSGSMTDSFDFVKYELKRSLQELEETSQFHIVFYSAGPPVEMAARRLMAATERNRGIAMEFIDTVIATGGTDPLQALERAFAVQPDLIYLLTDGEFDHAIVDHVKRLNVGGKVKVLTIGFLYCPDNEVLRAIAAQNGGEYRFVSEADLAEIVGR